MVWITSDTCGFHQHGRMFQHNQSWFHRQQWAKFYTKVQVKLSPDHCKDRYGSEITIDHEFSSTLWLFDIAMGNGPFIDDFPIKTSIDKGFSMAMLNNQMVIHNVYYKSCFKW